MHYVQGNCLVKIHDTNANRRLESILGGITSMSVWQPWTCNRFVNHRGWRTHWWKLRGKQMTYYLWWWAEKLLSEKAIVISHHKIIQERPSKRLPEAPENLILHLKYLSLTFNWSAWNRFTRKKKLYHQSFMNTTQTVLSRHFHIYMWSNHSFFFQNVVRVFRSPMNLIDPNLSLVDLLQVKFTHLWISIRDLFKGSMC